MDLEAVAAIRNFAVNVLQIFALLFAFALVLLVLYVLYMYLSDISQTKHAIRRNFPVLGRFRYTFEHLGEFFRQYFYALDREELPFNRAQRSWVYRAAKNVDSTVAFGSTRPLNQPGDVIFLNHPFPTLEKDAVPPEEVTVGEGYVREPYSTSSIFNISGMSFGALSVPAVTALSKGAAKAGIWLNTGEGGLSPYHLVGGCDIVFQIGTAKYGVRDAEGNLSDDKLRALAQRPQVKMFELKLSQGAKPGKGGILPGVKVTEEIARVRGIPVGQPSISPNGHPEFSSVDGLLDMLHHIREVTGKPTGFKTVVGASGWLREMCESIQLRGREYAPDFITIDSADGGSGAAPQSLMDYMGLPINRSLPLVVDLLAEYGLRDRVKVICSGKLLTPSMVAWALAMGADFVNCARGFMFALGCIQAMQCNKNTCPTGVTTHNPDLQRGLDPVDKAERVYNYARNMTREVGIIAHSCGVAEPRQLRRHHVEIIDERGMAVPLSSAASNVKPQSVIASDKGVT
ncbi:FMN-binding glutamate synthase family protein [Microbulbifer thermotolerans]|uniref:Glutamate synthase n=1 Tax=Microbulbifer thermotolerans TaxID=252514 RepID=A0A143HL27_MICTH|nr:FMN-binding glutamate synthase family protein [Microbulbifer thermotolerans]AMX02180.1 glutamate synthase [Microbulbifer thermotolerans]MCX2778849.1 FMN-binding glutamate synthase family protein [Microbulbifer thermotolerans]MCX2781879.1 FMN-binding glutamate synthase family protein [Microbulbifer thermotolerans]MCX2800919.1 FMN-binding glutamate synthase family protein [Microbulbifer thermotolerans]MCX2804154.1 FMN-binding glutamate synthase family protein [Microbulbifer thermotolerans]